MQLSLRGYAKKRGVTLRAVQKAIATGRIRKDADGKIDPDEADRGWSGATRPSPITMPPVQLALEESVEPPRRSHKHVEADGDREEYQSSRARREKAEADLAEIKLARENRDLLPADEVSKTLGQIGRIYAATREVFPTNAATKLVGKTDVNEIERILRAELTDVDNRISNEIANRFPEAGAALSRDHGHDELNS